LYCLLLRTAVLFRIVLEMEAGFTGDLVAEFGPQLTGDIVEAIGPAGIAALVEVGGIFSYIAVKCCAALYYLIIAARLWQACLTCSWTTTDTCK
jgi:hypothetical protein